MALEGSSALIFFVIFIIFFIVGTAYILMFLKRRADKKVREIKEPKVEDDAYNQIQMIKSMTKIMKNKGYNMSSIEMMISKAERAYDSHRYLESIEIVNNAKRALWRLKEEKSQEDTISPQVKKELEIIKSIEEKPAQDDMPPQVKDFVRKLPENYLQSKFEIGVVEEKIIKMEESEVKEYAKMYIERAKRAFEIGDYTEALRLAVKCNRMIDSGEVAYEETEKRATAIGASIAPLIEEEEEEKEELHCPKCGAIVSPEDKYCWNCGAKLVFIYKCPNCGGEVSSEDKFCRHCGYKLR
ncbi:amidophosphoribosyltransferase [Euryarchaeota archaeon ex4484_178]|nr:MAG: amidophosphoribosyltransferase [Euryarchaeota archaeon ex4484_178]